MKYSIAKGEAPAVCPRCALLDPEADEVDAVVTVGGYEDERGSRPILERFRCESNRHTEADLTPTQEGILLESAVEYIADAIEAMRDAHWDQKIDEYRNEERYGY